jgi:hypothetical protein
MLYDLTAERIIAHSARDPERLAATAKAVLQAAAQDLADR